MGKVKYLFIISICLTLVGCSSTEATSGYTIISETLDTITVANAEYIYTLDADTYEVVEHCLNTYSDIKPAIYVMHYEDYSLSYVSPITYYGTYYDFCGYITKLYSKGFVCKALNANAELYDILLESSDTKVRVIYQGKDEILILSENQKNSVCNPPYINGER